MRPELRWVLGRAHHGVQEARAVCGIAWMFVVRCGRSEEKVSDIDGSKRQVEGLPSESP